MIRFRFREDEQRFIRLHSEMFSRLARAGITGETGSEATRNVSKIEQMAYMEGVRQGLAIAAIAAETDNPDMRSHKAFQLHAVIYGSSDTPLRDVEKEWLGKLGLDQELLAGSWLDNKPMRFAPATLQEMSGEAPPVAPMMSIQSVTKPLPVTLHSRPFEPPPPESMHGAEVTPREPWERGEYEMDEDPDPDLDLTLALSRIDRKVRVEEAGERPEFLDLVRDNILALQRSGWKPESWQDLILSLHRGLHCDAGFLDLQLTTSVGRAVLDQCGLVSIAPADMLDLSFFTHDPSAERAADSAEPNDATSPTTADQGQ